MSDYTNEDIKIPIKLVSEPISNGFWHWVIENIILCRWQSFKNDPRSNYLVIKSGFTVIIIFGLIYILGVILYHIIPISFETSMNGYIKNNLNKIIIGFFGSTSLVYWQTAKMYQKKWLYCSELYNKIICLDPNEKEGVYRVLSNALAIDLVILDLWAHRSFKELFRDELKLAIDKEGDLKNYYLSKMIDGKLSESEAMAILQKHQYKLFKEQFNKNKFLNKFYKLIHRPSLSETKAESNNR